MTSTAPCADDKALHQTESHICQHKNKNGGLTGNWSREINGLADEGSIERQFGLMKTALGILLPLGLGSALMAQSDAPSPVGDFADGQEQWMPASRSAHETVWQRVEWATNALSRVVVRTNSYTELATGLNYYDAATQAWQPSCEEWEVYADGIAAGSAQAGWQVSRPDDSNYFAAGTLGYHLSKNAVPRTNGISDIYNATRELSGWVYDTYYATNMASLTNSTCWPRSH